jgi:hypothetical protein
MLNQMSIRKLIELKLGLFVRHEQQSVAVQIFHYTVATEGNESTVPCGFVFNYLN